MICFVTKAMPSIVSMASDIRIEKLKSIVTCLKHNGNYSVLVEIIFSQNLEFIEKITQESRLICKEDPQEIAINNCFIIWTDKFQLLSGIVF